MKRRTFRVLSVLVLVLALGLLAFFVCRRYRASHPPVIVPAVAETEMPASERTPSAAPTAEPTTEPTPEPTPAPPPYDSPVDFESLQAQNADVFAWLEIPGTTVSYPILQHPTEDEYYLNRNPDGSVGLPGSLFTFSGTAPDFTRFNTVVYGHNMADGSMFGALRDYGDMDFLQEHRDLIVYTPDAELHYRIFASVVFTDTLLNAAYDESSMADRVAFLNDVINYPGPATLVPGDTEVYLEDHIITLSTCVDNLPDMRRLILARLTEVEPEWRANNY